MATKRQAPSEQEPSTPTPQDDADILEELGAERDEDGNLVVSEEAIREVGAVDTESVRENRRQDAMVSKKNAHAKNVMINTGDVLAAYDIVMRSWPPNTVDIHVRRLTGTPFQEVITTRPKNGTELFAALKALHGQHEEAQYFIECKDNTTQRYRCKGKITIRDARPPQQQGQPLPPPGYPPPPAPPNGASQQSPFALLQEALDTVQRLREMQPQQTAPQPSPQAPAQTGSPFSLLQEALDAVQRLQGMNPQPQQSSAQPPAQQPELNEALQLVESLQRMIRGAQPPPTRAAQQPAPQQPSYPFPAPPSKPAPHGMMWEWLPEYETFALVPRSNSNGNGGGNRNPMFRSRPIYDQQSDPGERPYYPERQPQPQRQQSPADQVRDALGVVRQTMHAVREMGSVLGQPEYEAPPIQEQDDDDSPVKVVESGSSKLVYDKVNGSLRPWDSVLANLPGMMKWAGEQREAIQKGAEERQRREHQAQREQLPQSQPEYVAVPVDDRLPPPPHSVPPPIRSEQPSEESPWGAPTTPKNEE